MVRVPVSTDSSRSTQPLGNDRLRFTAARDFTGRAVEQFGRAGQQAAQAWDAIEATYDEADALRLDNEMRNRVRERTLTGEDAYLSKRGFAAGETREQVVADISGDAESLLENARSERARMMARRAFDVRIARAEEQIGAHAVREMETARIAQSNARIEGAITDAIDARGTDQFAVNLGLAQQELASNATRLGWSEEELREKSDALISSTYARTALAIDAEDGEPTRALEFVEANADLIGPEEQARLTAQLAPRVDGAWAQGVVQSGELDKYLITEATEAQPTAAVNKAGEPVGDGSAIIKELFPQARITSGYRGPDHPLTKRNPRSYHTTGAAVDTAAIPGMSFDEYVAQIKAAGYTVIEAINEYENPSAHATGGHWHVVIGGEGQAGVAPGAPGVAADPRLDSRRMRQAVDSYIADNPGISERRKQALYAAADQSVNVARADRAQAEQDADRRLQDWLTQNMPNPDDLTSMSQIPAAVMAGISPGTTAALQQRIQITQARIEDRAAQEAAGRAAQLEAEAIFELYTKTDDELARTDMREYIGRIDLNKLGPWFERQERAAARVQGGAGAFVSGDRIASRIDTLGKDFGASRALDADPDERQLWADVRGYVEERIAGRPNKDVSDDELRSIILGGLQEAQLYGTGWFGTNIGNRTIPRAQISNEMVDLDDVPAEMVTQIRQGLQRGGLRNPTTRDIWTAYQEGRARGVYP